MEVFWVIYDVRLSFESFDSGRSSHLFNFKYNRIIKKGQS